MGKLCIVMFTFHMRGGRILLLLVPRVFCVLPRHGHRQPCRNRYDRFRSRPLSLMARCDTRLANRLVHGRSTVARPSSGKTSEGVKRRRHCCMNTQHGGHGQQREDIRRLGGGDGTAACIRSTVARASSGRTSEGVRRRRHCCTHTQHGGQGQQREDVRRSEAATALLHAYAARWPGPAAGGHQKERGGDGTAACTRSTVARASSGRTS